MKYKIGDILIYRNNEPGKFKHHLNFKIVIIEDGEPFVCKIIEDDRAFNIRNELRDYDKNELDKYFRKNIYYNKYWAELNE